MNVQSLKEARSAKADEYKTLYAMGEAEGRDLTAEDVETLDGLEAEIEGLDTNIAEAEKREAFVKSMAKEEEAVTKNVAPMGNSEIREMESVTKELDVTGAINALANNQPLTGAAAELDQEARSNNPSIAGHGFNIPASFLTRGLTAGTATDGAEFVATEKGAFIDALAAEPIVAKLGATYLTGLVGNVEMPRLNTQPTAAAVAETANNESDPQFDTVTLTARRASVYTDVSQQLIAQGNVADRMIGDIIGKELARFVDRMAFTGSGSSNQPTGLLNTTGVQTHDVGADGIDLAEYLDMMQKVGTANGDLDRAKFLMTHAQGFAAMGAAIESGDARRIMENGLIGGKEVVMSSQYGGLFPVFGDFSQLMIGEWGGLNITVDNLSLAHNGQVRVVANKYYDVAVANPAAFCVAVES